MKKNTPIIEDIIISEEQKEAYNLRLKGNPESIIQVSRQCKEALAKEYFGSCSICAGIPTKKIIYDAGAGAKLVERYCDKCFQRLVKEEGQELRRYTKEDKVYLTATNGIDQTLAIKMEEWRERNGYGTNTKT